MYTGTKRSLFIACSLILGGCQLGNQVATPDNLPPSATIGKHSQTYTYHLDNGLQVVLWPNRNSHSKNEASVNLVIHAGSLQETDDQLGYAHFVEHMLFNQPDENGTDPVFSKLQALDIEMVNHANAYTTYDHTRYYLNLPNASEQRLKQAIGLLSQFAYQSQFDAQEVSKEIGVVREEWRRSEPEKQTYTYQRQQLELANSRHLQRRPIGTLASIEAASSTALRDYYQQHYRPSNATLIITGDINTAAMIAEIENQFAAWSKQGVGHAQTYTKPTMRPASYDVFADKLEPAFYLWVGNSYAHPLAKDEASEFTNFKINLVADLLHERLQKLATQQNNSIRDLSSGVYGTAGNFVEVGIGLRSQHKDLETATQLIGSVINNIKSNGFKQVELVNARTQVLENERVQQDGATHLANIATDHVVDGIWLRDQKHYLGMFEKHLPNLSTTDLNQMANALFSQPFKIEMVSKPGANNPSESELRNWLATGLETRLAVPVTQAADSDINWNIQQPAGSIVSQQTLSNGIHTITLSNGIKVNYRYSDSAPGKFYMRLLAVGGYDIMEQQEIIDTRLGLEVMGASGLQSLDGHQLKSWLEGQALTLQPEINIDSRGFHLDGPSDKAETLLQLLHVALQDARVDPALYKHYMPQFQQQIDDLESLAYVDYIHQIEDHVSQGNPAFRSLSIDEIQSVSADKMLSIYQQYIAGAQNYTLNIVGDIALPKLLPYLEAYIASLPQQEQTPRIAKATPKWPGNVYIEGKGSNQKAATLGYNLQLEQTPTDANFHIHASLLGDLLTKRLGSVIREDLGLTYSVASNVQRYHVDDPMVTLAVQLECDPNQVDKVIASIDKTLATLKTEGFSQAAVERQIDIKRGDFINEQHQAKHMLWKLVQAQVWNFNLAGLHDPKIVYPDTNVNRVNHLLQDLVNKHHSRTVTVLMP